MNIAMLELFSIQVVGYMHIYILNVIQCRKMQLSVYIYSTLLSLKYEYGHA